MIQTCISTLVFIVFYVPMEVVLIDCDEKDYFSYLEIKTASHPINIQYLQIIFDRHIRKLRLQSIKIGHELRACCTVHDYEYEPSFRLS